MSMNTCPQCGGKKATQAKTCQTCYLGPKKEVRAKKRICPKCGGPKSGVSKTCRKCRETPEKYICPDCGGKKTHKAIRCRKCNAIYVSKTYVMGRTNTKRKYNVLYKIEAVDIDFSGISTEWLCFFSGLFCGEGFVTIVKNKQRRTYGDVPYHTYNIVMGITMRDDEMEMITDIHQKFNGQLKFYDSVKEKSKPSIRWRTSKINNIKAICEAIIEHSPLPAKKLKEVQNVLDFIEWRLSRVDVIDWTEAEHFYLQNKDLKSYS